MTEKLTTEKINELIGVDDSWKAPSALLKTLFDKEKREELFKTFLDVEYEMQFDWFHEYFQDESADRKKLKQDFTPESVAKLLNGLVAGVEEDTYDNYFETAVGTGGILITHWHETRIKESPFTYTPSEHFHHVEELSDRAIPFLLFNCLIRGMNVVIVHGDALTRESRGVFFIQNENDDHMQFSSLNVMPYTEMTEDGLDVNFIEERYPEHVESTSWPRHLGSFEY